MYEVYVQQFPEGGGCQQVSVSGGHTPSADQIIVVQNSFEELRRLVPTD